jgi:phosphoribosylformylglycinamidine synthase
MVQLSVESSQRDQRWDRLLFGEGGARIIVSIGPDQQADWEAYLGDRLAGFWQRLGTVQGDTLTLTTQVGQVLVTDAVSDLAQTWNTAIEQRLAGES